ncbi:ABC transporter permease [Pseudogulbenkiania sp. MAI-1]|uniref:ABC transporter permease n=1 Tax=Pseudogulbenkiania sp. MAI-1 TaxID=990370 RepID=UPI00045EB427|nr:ABC transporter permease [Pseudogulbenkiania sp. MAI-1]
MSTALSTAVAPERRRFRFGAGQRGIRLLLPATLLLCLFFLLPVLALLLRSVMEPTPGLQNYVELLGSETYVRVFFNTFMVAGVVTLITLLIGFPTAWLLAILPKRWSQLLFAVLLLSMWTNLLARTYGWMVLLQQTGLVNRMLMAIGVIDEPLTLVNNLVGVTIGMTYIMLPFLVMPLHATLRAIDPSTLRAAAVCGASRWQALRLVLLPLALPGIASGALMVFVMSLGYYVTPALLGGTSYMMLAELIAQLVQSLLNWGLAGAAAFVLLVVTLGLYAVQLRYLGGGRTGLGGR